MSVPAAKHAAPTKGPWYVRPVFICQPNEAAIHFSEYVLTELGASSNHPIRPREEAEANARLMEAAPDLLEVAQLFLVLDKTDVVSDKTYIEIMHDIAEKAGLAVRRALGKD